MRAVCGLNFGRFNKLLIVIFICILAVFSHLQNVINIWVEQKENTVTEAKQYLGLKFAENC